MQYSLSFKILELVIFLFLKYLMLTTKAAFFFITNTLLEYILLKLKIVVFYLFLYFKMYFFVTAKLDFH